MECKSCCDHGMTECEGADFICPECGYTGAEGRALEARIKRATDLLREWRDEFGGKAAVAHKNQFGELVSASPSDLLRDTQRFIEGKL